MDILKIIDICLIILLLVFGIEAVIKFKKVENEKVEDVRKTLTIRINIIMLITVLTSIVTILNVLLNR